MALMVEHAADVVDDVDYESVGSSRRHWLLRQPDQLWQVAAVAAAAALAWMGVGYAIGRNVIDALVSGAAFGLVSGLLGALRLRGKRRA